MQPLHYDALISYGHQADARMAPALQRELERIGVPWWKRSDLRIFRDEASLSASAELWRSIEAALEVSRHLVLLASPAAAASPWVDREVRWWLHNRSPSTLFIVVTSGSIAFDRRAGDFDRAGTDCLPPSLHGVYREEPLWTDMRFASGAGGVRRGDPRFRSAVLGLAAALRGMPKDALESVDTRARRRALLVALGSVGSLGVAAVASLAIAYSASGQASARALESQSRRLAAEALEHLEQGHQVELATLKAAIAWRLAATDDARRALVKIDAGTSGVVRVLGQHTGWPRLMAFTPDNTRLLTVAGDGVVLQWSTADGGSAGPALATRPQDPRKLALSRDGSSLLLFGNRGDDIFLDVFRMRDGARTDLSEQLSEAWESRERPFISCVAISPSGTRIAAAGQGKLVTIHLPTGERQVRSLAPSSTATAIAFNDDNLLTLATVQDDAAQAAQYDLQHGRVRFGPKRRADSLPGECWTGASSNDADSFIVAKQHMHRLYIDPRSLAIRATRLPDEIRWNHGNVNIEIDARARRLAFGSGGSAHVWDLESRRLLRMTPRTVGSSQPVALSPDGTLVATLGAGGTPVLWTVDAEQPARMVKDARCASQGLEDACIQRLCERISASTDEARMREIVGPAYESVAARLRSSTCRARPDTVRPG